jgi:CBS domain-containing protein
MIIFTTFNLKTALDELACAMAENNFSGVPVIDIIKLFSWHGINRLPVVDEIGR